MDYEIMLDANYIYEKGKGRCTLKYIKSHYPDDYEQIVKLPYSTFAEQLYRYLFPDATGTCAICGAPVRFLGANKGYRKYCSAKCSYQDPSRIENMKSTNLKKYGVDFPMQSAEIQSKLNDVFIAKYGKTRHSNPAKAKNTCLKKYGVEHYSLTQEYTDRARQTNLEKYGVENVMMLQEIREKIKQTNIERHGVSCVLASAANVEKAHNMRWEKNWKYGGEVIERVTENDSIKYKVRCPHQESCNKCSERYFIIEPQIYRDRIRHQTETCTRLIPERSTNQNTTIELFIKSILDENHIEYESGNRSIISPYELDIYIPSKNIAIECNGVYWHSQKDKSYHQHKYNLCQRAGVQLITIWEDWVHRVPNIVRSLILSKLGIYKERIGARSCVVREINGSTANKFLNHNHIQGGTRASIHLGLYYNDSLYGVMTFSHKSKLSGSKNINSSEWELSRFCTKCNTQIVGGAEKLLKYFIRHYHPLVISSFSSNDISNGNLYKKLGFTSDLKSNESYWYVDSRTYNRYHRSSFTKNNIIKKGLAPNKDNWTESEAMSSTQYLKIYDTGTIKWTMTIL